MENEFEKGFMCGYLLGHSISEEESTEPYRSSWEYPNDWLHIPEPSENQIKLLVSRKAFSTGDIIFKMNIYYSKKSSKTNTYVDYGDGSEPVNIKKKSDKNNRYYYISWEGHTFKEGTGHKTINSEQWIVTINFDKSLNDEYYYISAEPEMEILGMKIGHSKYVGNPRYAPRRLVPYQAHTIKLHYLKVCNGLLDFVSIRSTQIRKIELNSSIAEIPANMQLYSRFLRSINLDNIVSIGDYTFENAYSLINPYCPNLESVGKKVFSETHITEITEKTFPKLKSIGDMAFQYCYWLETLDSEIIETINDRAFSCCGSLKYINLPNVKSVGSELGVYTALYAYLPLCEKVGNNAFINQVNLKEIDLRSCTEFGTNPFGNTYRLKKIIIPEGTDISNYCTNIGINCEIEYYKRSNDMNEFEKGFVAGMLAPKKKSENPYANYDDNWSYPSYWLQLPEPKENQVIMLIDNKGGTINSEESYTYIPHINIIENTKTTINWGDGSDIESISDVNESGHVYERDKGHSSIKSKQWIVTITFDEDAEAGSEYISTLQYDDSSMYVLAMKIGHSKYIGNYENNRILASCNPANLHYAKICRGEFDFSFIHASYLRQVELNKYITSIPERAFYYNYLLETVNTENIECINKQGFEYCYRFNSNFPKLEKVCEEGLYSTKIREITDSNFPKLKTIGTRSFGNFNGTTFFKKIDSNSIETIESYAFDYCYKLENVKINSVKSIGEDAFNNCYSLKSVELQKCEHIGNGAFSNCYMLQTADIRKTDNVDLFGSSHESTACTDLKKLIVPSGLEFDKVSLFRDFMYLDIQYV